MSKLGLERYGRTHYIYDYQISKFLIYVYTLGRSEEPGVP